MAQAQQQALKDKLIKAEKLFRQNKLTEAEALCKEVLAADPRNVVAMNILGGIALHAKNYQAAIIAFNESIKVDPSYTDAIANLGEAFFGIEDYAKAKTCYDQLVKLQPQDVRAQLRRAEMLVKTGQYDELKQALAQPALQPAMLEDKALRRTRQCLDVMQTWFQNQFEDCEVHCQQLITDFPDFFYGYLYYGSCLIQHRIKIEEGLEQMEKAVQLNPKGFSTIYNLCQFYYQLHQIDRIREHAEALEQAGETSPHNLGVMYIMLAIDAYLEGALDALPNLLKKAEPLVQVNRAILEQYQDNARIYYNYLLRLYDYRYNRPELYANPEGADTLHILGESHALSPADCHITWQGQSWRCQSSHVVGVKAWHLASGKPNHHQEFFQRKLDALPKDAPLAIFLGEIDTRRNEGILKVYDKSPEPARLDEIIRNTVTGYVAYIADQAKQRSAPTLLANIPAPAEQKLHGLDESGIDRVKYVVTEFNRIMAEEAATHNLPLIDVYNESADSDGSCTEDAAIDGYHVTPHTVVNAFKKL